MTNKQLLQNFRKKISLSFKENFFIFLLTGVVKFKIFASFITKKLIYKNDYMEQNYF